MENLWKGCLLYNVKAIDHFMNCLHLLDLDSSTGSVDRGNLEAISGFGDLYLGAFEVINTPYVPTLRNISDAIVISWSAIEIELWIK